MQHHHVIFYTFNCMPIFTVATGVYAKRTLGAYIALLQEHRRVENVAVYVYHKCPDIHISLSVEDKDTLNIFVNHIAHLWTMDLQGRYAELRPYLWGETVIMATERGGELFNEQGRLIKGDIEKYRKDESTVILRNYTHMSIDTDQETFDQIAEWEVNTVRQIFLGGRKPRTIETERHEAFSSPRECFCSNIARQELDDEVYRSEISTMESDGPVKMHDQSEQENG